MTLRINKHLFDLKNGIHHSSHLQRSFVKYGGTAFVCSVLQESNKADLISNEQWWINIMNSSDGKNGYNVNPNARSCMGSKRTPEQIAALSVRVKQWWASRSPGAERARYAAKHKTLEWRKNIGLSSSSRTPETLIKMSFSAKKRKVNADMGAARMALAAIPSEIRRKWSSHLVKKVVWHHPDHGNITCGVPDLLSKFKESKLDRQQLNRVRNGKQRICKGWTIL